MVNFKKNPKLNLLYFLIFIVTICGCGSDMNTPSNDTGSLSFALKWENPSNNPTFVLPLNKGRSEEGLSYAPIDCTAIGVSTVSANVYDSGGTYITSGGPWNCADHSGTITGISAGINRMIAISGKDSSNKIIYSGQITGVTINKDQTTDAGQITMTYVANDTTAPTDGSLSATAGNQQVSLSWSGFSDSGSGLGSYKLVYSTTSTPSSCSSGTQIWTGTGTSYTHTGLNNGGTYYYRVCATDNAGNTSSGATTSGIPTASGTTTGGTTTTGTTTTVQGGIDSYTKLMLHTDGSDQGASFTDSETTPKTVTNTETYDSYTKLMLHTDGSGNSFTDSAVSKAVTTNGDVTQTTAQYKLGSKSAVFDGSADYLSLADSDDWDFGSGDFTIDCWVRFNSLLKTVDFASQTNDLDNSWAFFWDSGGNLEFQAFVGGVAKANYYVSWAPTIGVWYHLAAVRNGSSFYIFVDGVSQTLTVPGAISTNALPNLTANLYIGTFFPSVYVAIRIFNGWIDELRISKGVARWTSNFTPPSSPYGKVATVTSQKKFGTASGEFHGSGEYLSLADSDDWYFGSGDFTIDTWVRLNSMDTGGVVSQRQNFGNWWDFYLVNNGIAHFEQRVGGTTNIHFEASWSPSSTDIWYHLAVVRSGNNWYFFKNGISQTFALTEGNASNSISNFAGALRAGIAYTDAHYLNGYLDELRISKGIARWTSNFTPPSAPYE